MLLQIPANMVNVYNGTWASVERSRARPCCSQAHKSKTFPPIHVPKLCNQLPPLLTEKDFLEKHNRKKSSLAFPAKYASFSMRSGFSIVGRASKRKLTITPLEAALWKMPQRFPHKVVLVKCLTIGTSPSDLQCCLNFVYAAANKECCFLPHLRPTHAQTKVFGLRLISKRVTS